mmetsp:Transcript_14544/g.24152  ORF Transcript_14544/g.24152 Transcript_14544/m.24152 type:complete len:332 (+) Transcript_14544:201-1196(+)|eukprot:CAMPEP_0114438234 /NCGR_PEP_ID=MMETSP0103-20121206/14478_1 /TAXON_ID=37642 ORGANISM="Paraphysomonas imperforata, Strain PA2" /NCGR_SAMPLE_ID=MMETSP0103 /ASSEMBLY_ACC=CAM_ASM_000201 /LENGTH=331 /DNA_ID=CAMNT_0001608759 /DNA_START=75 /DNA_END=1070 /DNA_ORIENTATION=-
MMMNAQKKDPQLVAQIQDMIESGMEPQKIADTLLEQAERVREGLPAMREEEQEFFSDEIIIASQALAYRDAIDDDVDVIVRIINAAYEKEVVGPEAFREGPGTVSGSEVRELLVGESSYQWVLLEVPCGMNIETDGTVLGVCCYTTDGICRKNGEVEGNLGSIRYFAVTPRYHGVLIGHRFLKKVEDLMTKAGCCRIMTCIPDARLHLIHWLLDRGYSDVNTMPYPSKPAGHTLTKLNTKLVMLAKPLPLLPQPPKATTQSQEYRAAATAKFIGQNEDVAEDEEQGVDKTTAAPLPPAGNPHLPPHWRGVQSMGRVASTTDEHTTTNGESS